VYRFKITEYKKSDLQMVKSFLNRFEDKTQWTNDEIQKRGKALGDLAYRHIWAL
jgi:hypothetical protein